MAGEYSRELSVKVSAGQRRLVAMGFWQGGPPPFGMQRQLVSQNEEPKQILQPGEWKNIGTDRVVLPPGPQKAIDTIRVPRARPCPRIPRQDARSRTFLRLRQHLKPSRGGRFLSPLSPLPVLQIWIN